MTQTRESRPSGSTEAASNNRVGTRTQDTETRGIPHLSGADIASARPLHVLIVKTTSDRVARRCYLSLDAAERAAQRARARGHAVTLELHAVVPAPLAEAVTGDA